MRYASSVAWSIAIRSGMSPRWITGPTVDAVTKHQPRPPWYVSIAMTLPLPSCRTRMHGVLDSDGGAGVGHRSESSPSTNQ